MNKVLKIGGIYFLLAGFIVFNQPWLIVNGQEVADRESLRTGIFNEIVNTGESVENSTSTEQSSQTQVENSNQSTVNQSIEATANTGFNETNRNISIGGNAGMITTGNVIVNTIAQVNTNENTTAITDGSNGALSATDIVNTGDDVQSQTSSRSTLHTLVNNDNTTYINQTVNSSANTGNNIADRNISIGGSSGVISTGTATTTVDFLVSANGNATLVGGVSNGNGPGSGASIILTNTGDRSRFGDSSSNYSQISISNQNNAHIVQSCFCSSNTGNNTSNRGIGIGTDSGVITTGNAVVKAGLFAQANRNNTQGIGNSGSVAGISDIANTGDDSNFSNSSLSQNNTSIANDNSASVDQIVSANANTGYNTASRNISIGGNAGIIRTGNAVVNVFTVADVNNSATNWFWRL